MRYFTSDPHFSHAILKWCRPQFNSVEEMDNFLVQLYTEWSKKLKPQDEFYCLGDWGNTDYLWLLDNFKSKTIFCYGNHDRHSDLNKFKEHFDIVYEYPFYISDRLCVSHVPQNMFDDELNIHGHLHGNIIDKPNYMSTCLEVNNYRLVSEKYIDKKLSKLPKYNRRHLQAPYTEWEKVIYRPQNDLILKPNNHIDVSAMRTLQYINRRREESK